MPNTKNFQLRIDILDELLNSPRKKNMKELLEALNDKLKFNGESPIAKRSLYDDINYLINEKAAPIVREASGYKRIYYSENFSIKNLPLNEEDVSYLRQAIDILKKASDFTIINEVEEIVARLENKVHTRAANGPSFIFFEQSSNFMGHLHLDNLYNAIQGKCVLKITYQPFGKEPREWIIHPYLLKEYRNRWFLICRRSGSNFVINLALDRIKRISNCLDKYEENDLFDPTTYFDNLIGVTVPVDKVPERIVFKVMPEMSDYILTKPLHKSQEVVKKYKNGALLMQLVVYVNYELQSLLLSFGPKIKVQEPKALNELMGQLYSEGTKLYS